MVKPFQTNPNYLILMPINIKSILMKFDRFENNYGSIFVFLLPNFLVRRCAGPTSKDSVSVKIKMEAYERCVNLL